MTNLRLTSATLALILLLTGFAFAQSEASAKLDQGQIEIPTTIPAAAQPSAHFDVDAATEAYLAEMPASARSRSDAYFEGGYWLILWDFLYGVVVALLLLNLRWSAAMRNLAERITRFSWLQTFLYWVQYLLLTTLLTAPIAIYEGYIREHQYGLANQTFGPWLGDQFKALLINIFLGGLLVVVLFALVRKLPRTWWIWGSVVTMMFVVFGIMIGPVFLQPMFNKIVPLNNPQIKQPILSMARANNIPANDVYEIDASKQTTRMSANVSGFGQTMRITLNDNLLRRGSPQEIEAVMGHEMGHYVLNHIPKTVMFLLILTVCFFAYLRWGLNWSLARWGEKWQIRGIGDPAVLPLVTLLAAIFFFILTPITNTQTRAEETEADMYGLNASRQPDGAARAALHLGEYRKMRPTAIEEIIFYDHPSGYNRIHRAMQWKKENQALFKNENVESGSTGTTSSPGSESNSAVWPDFRER